MMIHNRHSLAMLLLAVCLSAPAGAKTIALGNSHTCAITTAGKAMCWGDDSSGQLGNGSTAAGPHYLPVAAKLAYNDILIAITAGGMHTCGLLKTGLVKCWGDNSAGQLGSGKVSPVEATPVGVVAINYVKDVKAGYKHTCALLGSGKVMCWGDNSNGQLGNGTFKSSAIPTEVANISNATSIALGANHSCALTKDTGVKCWGKNKYGELGNNSKLDSPTPVSTLGLIKQATLIAAGGERTCTIMTDKTVLCWGWDNWPTLVTGLNNIGILAVGDHYTCAQDLSTPTVPKVKCWGMNTHAELGLAGGATAGPVNVPTLISITDPIIDVAIGGDHTCAIKTISGIPVLLCWGNDTFGQTGIDPQGGPRYIKTDPNNPRLTFSPAPTGIYSFPISSASTPLDAISPPPAPAPTAPPPAGACTYTYSAWTACLLQNWGWWQTRIATSKTPASCKGEPVVSQYCTPPPPICAIGQKWDPSSQKCLPSGVQPGGNPGAGGGSPATNNVPLKPLWAIKKPIIVGLMNDLAKATKDKADALTAFQKNSLAGIEPAITALLNKQPVPPVVAVAGKAAVDTAIQKQKDSATAVITALTGILVQDIDPKLKDTDSQNVLSDAAFAYFNTILISTSQPLVNSSQPNCNADPILNQSIYNYAYTPFFTMLHCLSQSQVNFLDQAVFTAFDATVKLFKAARPAYAEDVQSALLQMLSPTIFSIYERDRFQGNDVPSRKLMLTFMDHLNSTPNNQKSPVEPPSFVLYNTVTKLAEVTPICAGSVPQSVPPVGEFFVWSVPYKCMVFKTFANVAMDPMMNKSLTCSFWDTARVGKPCLALPVKTSLLEKLGRAISELLIPSAYADTAACKQKTDFETTLFCVDQLPPPNIPKPCLMGLDCPCGGYISGSAGGGKNSNDWKTCSAALTAACNSGVSCGAPPTPPPTPPPGKCGDKTVDPGEECDDGNTKDGDGCSASCKKQKIWCEACYKLRDQNKNCQSYYQIKKDFEANPDCKVPYTETDSACSPLKKGQSCAYAVLYLGKLCNNDTKECFAACTKIEGLPPFYGTLTEAQKNACLESQAPTAPTWLNNFSAPATETANEVLKAINDNSNYGKNILALKGQGDGPSGVKLLFTHWWAVVALMQSETGQTYTYEEATKALDYALEILQEAQPSATGSAGAWMAQYDYDKELIEWDTESLKNATPESAADTGAHEALHAAIDYLLAYHEENQQMSTPELCTYGYDLADHWIFDVLRKTVPGFKITAQTKAGENKSTFCPLFLEGQQ